MSKFLQFHTLTPYSGVLLNRDDAGFAKTLPFGNAKRTRVSSQCLKYHWRKYEGKHAIRDAGEMSIRSRRTFRKKVAVPLINEDYPAGLVYIGTMSVRCLLLNETSYLDSNNRYLKKSSTNSFFEAGQEGERDILHTDQVVVFGQAEIRQIKNLIRKYIAEIRGEYGENEAVDKKQILDKSHKYWKEYYKPRGSKKADNLRGLRNAMGIDAAMHGRMVTSDVLARGNAAVHVAHAITTHAQQREDDYFTAVDDLLDEDTGGEESGSAHLNTKQLTSGLFYNYVVVDVPLLVSNLESCERSEWTDADLDLAVEVLRRFLHTLATVSPGAKLSSTAPYAKAEFIMVESGDEQPRTLANSFKKAVPLTENVTEDSIERLTDYVDRMDGMYATEEDRICATTEEADLPAPNATLPDIADWIETNVTTYASS
jgi:CRISPR system Cascade subunit CasC